MECWKPKDLDPGKHRRALGGLKALGWLKGLRGGLGTGQPKRHDLKKNIGKMDLFEVYLAMLGVNNRMIGWSRQS
jgi:hypothetical protein